MLYQFKRCQEKIGGLLTRCVFVRRSGLTIPAMMLLPVCVMVVIALQHFEEIFLVGFLRWEKFCRSGFLHRDGDTFEISCYSKRPGCPSVSSGSRKLLKPTPTSR